VALGTGANSTGSGRASLSKVSASHVLGTNGTKTAGKCTGCSTNFQNFLELHQNPNANPIKTNESLTMRIKICRMRTVTVFLVRYGAAVPVP